MPDDAKVIIDRIAAARAMLPSERQPRCLSSRVELRDDVMIGDYAHSGSVSHRCALAEGHEGWCRCACSLTWEKWRNIK